MGSVEQDIAREQDMASNTSLSLSLVFVFLVFALVNGRRGRTLRTGEMTSEEMSLVHSLMSGMASPSLDMSSLVIPPPPVDMMEHRKNSPRCSLGTRNYCPGEILFRVGIKNLKAKVCTASGKFETLRIPGSYKEPQRCQHRSVEYCSGEFLRGFSAWNYVQQCRSGRLELQAMHHSSLAQMMPRINQTP